MESDYCIKIGLTDTTARNIQDFRNDVMDSSVFLFVKSKPNYFEEEIDRNEIVNETIPFTQYP